MEKRFIFRGNAVGVAGHIQQPDDLIIWVQGASSLPVIGGYSRSSVDRAAFGDVLSFDSVRTQATGDFSDTENAYKTLELRRQRTKRERPPYRRLDRSNSRFKASGGWE